MNKQIILASQSPRRKQLLKQAEITFSIVVKDVVEDYPADLDIALVPEYIARNKAIAVLAAHENAIIIAADTIVVLNDEVIGKPKDETAAIETLTKLSGNIHQVITGVYITDGVKTVTFSSKTDVHFLTLDEATIKHYVAQYKPYDKAGAYAIQEYIGAIGIEKIDGDYYNVMGLPINKVVRIIKIW